MIWNWDKLDKRERWLLVELIVVTVLSIIGFIYAVFVIATSAASEGLGEALYRMGWALVEFPLLGAIPVFIIGLVDYYMR